MTTSSSDPWMFQDTSTECAICLERLDDEDYALSQGESSAKSITIRLACGHRWHLQCLKEQLELARPTSTKRLLFSGCQCAKCGTICEHEALEDYTRTTDALRQKVDALLERQLNNDAASLDSTKQNHDNDDDTADQSRLLLAWEKVKDSANPEAKEQVLREARRKYAFYLCSHCHEPYFGGTVECSDGMVADEGASDNEPRLCMACTPQVVCRNPLEHLGSIVWKCRYCCQPATHVCYGNVHFCDACHDRNTERVKQLQSWKRDGRLARRSGERSKSAGPPPLEPSACPGIDCPFPKPSSSGGHTGNSTSASAECHSNGPTPDCEQVYTCLLCQSASSSASASAEEQPGSHNLLTNPSGQLGLQGWQQLNRRRPWQVEESEWPVNAQTTTNFVSSFEPCVMVQIIDLQQVVPNLLSQYGETSFRNNDFAVQVSARYQARTDCPSVFQLAAIAMDRNQRQVARLQTDVLDAPPDHWAKAELVFEHLSLERVNYVAIMVTGKDQRFWQGNFGSKVADCSIRILWDENNANVNEGRSRNAAFERNVNETNINPVGQQVHETMEQQPVRTSQNLLTNPSGQLGLEGWRQLNRRRSWQVENSDRPVNGQTTTNFVSSFEPCIMTQVVDLRQVVPDLLAQYGEASFRSNDFAVQVSARYQARTDCPSVFQLAAIAMDRNQRQVARLQTDVLDAPPDHWATAELVLEHLSLETVNFIAIEIMGKDQRFWQGNFGSKVADCSIRIVWDDS